MFECLYVIQPTRGRPAAVHEGMARLARAMTSPIRLRVLNLIAQGPQPVEALAVAVGESPANTSAHLKVLKDAGLVVASRAGKRVLHALREPAALRLFMALRAAAEGLDPAVEQLARAQAADPAHSALAPEELGGALARGRVWLLDLRPASEYAAGHLPGARSLPAAELPARLASLPRTRRLLTYCRGKYCPTARHSAALMRAAGLRAERLAFGVPEWRAAGLELSPGGAP